VTTDPSFRAPAESDAAVLLTFMRPYYAFEEELEAECLNLDPRPHDAGIFYFACQPLSQPSVKGLETGDLKAWDVPLNWHTLRRTHATL
jgi:hypothetical protein